MASEEAFEQAIRLIASVDGILMEPSDLAEDIFLLNDAFPDETAFTAAVLNTKRALEQLAADVLTPASLDRDLDGWQSYHYQHKRKQGAAADMRIVFRRAETGLQIRGFGRRAVPFDIYHRLVVTRA